MQQTHRPHTDERLSQTPATPQKITRDILDRYQRTGSTFRMAVLVLGILSLLGLVGIGIRLAGGFEHRAAWGYYAATYVFIMSTFQGAPLAAVATRLARGDWRRGFTRVADLFAVTGLLTLPMFIPMLLALPPLEGRRSVWMGWPGAPYLYDTVAMILLPIVGLGLLYASALPDLAVVRDHARGARARWLTGLAATWAGTPRQWRVAKQALFYLLGPFYLMMFVFAHFLLAADFSMALVPGWIDAIYPAFHAVTALQAGLATLIIAMALVRRFGGCEQYIHMEHFWGLSKLLLALTLMFFYHWWSSFIILWYGKKPNEQLVLQTLMFGPYFVPFALGWLFSFFLPFFTIIWNPVRKSITGMVIVASMILVGNFFDRVRLYVSAFSIENPAAHQLEQVPPFTAPDLVDIMIIVGSISLAALLYLLAARVIPVIALWEVKEGLLYRVVRPFYRGHVTVIAKPD
ncbi:MAG: hypothetical protein HY689_11520 [Chloroflexi bacterium]|nr:hypothetical protein [Chloroflexota bacterium]